MKNYAIITPNPDLVEKIVMDTIIRKSITNDVANIEIINLRDFTKGGYQQVDDSPFGGGAGMVMMPEPFFNAIDYTLSKWNQFDNVDIIYPSPQGKKWSQSYARDISDHNHIIFLCGHYKGIDERVIEKYVTNEFSLGDYVISCGELASMVMLDSIIRLIPGVVNSYNSVLTDSFMNGLLDSPSYTRPRVIKGMSVPDVLLNGNHKQIESWKRNKRIEFTRRKRRDLWEKYVSHQNNGDRYE